jgi:transcriptional antiterminator RfaH
MAYWSVAQTQPFAEKKAKRFLEGQSFDCYLPKILVTQHIPGWRASKRTREFALFARYLFVRIESAWHAINSTPGISCLLLDGGMKPITVGEKVISELRSREDHNGFVILPKKEKFKVGQQVKVVSGQFQGQLALYDGMTSRQRERVLLQLLGQYVPVELNIDSRIEAVSLN